MDMNNLLSMLGGGNKDMASMMAQMTGGQGQTAGNDNNQMMNMLPQLMKMMNGNQPNTSGSNNQANATTQGQIKKTSFNEKEINFTLNKLYDNNKPKS